MDHQLGRLTTMDPREVWTHEAYDFTPWLLDNADALADALGIDLEISAAEHPVGGFSLDLIGRDLTNDCVLIVENQLSATDHGHLGQLVTYAAGTDAGTIVWLATSFREEHRQALDFLNHMGGEDVRFFGIEIGVVRIGTSPPAPMFRLRAEPNDWHAGVSAVASSASRQSGKGLLYEHFWTRFLERVRREMPGWTNARKAPADNWFSMPGAIRGATTFVFSFPQGGQLRTELYIDTGDADRNLQIFRSLERQRQAIEESYGAPLSWEELPQRRACRVADYAPGDVTVEDRYDHYIDWFLETGLRMRKAIPAAVPVAED